MAKKRKYYTIRKILEQYSGKEYKYYVIFGERSNGKTHSSLDYATDNFFRTGEQFAYIRRFGEDIRKKNLMNLFAGIENLGLIEKYSNGKYIGVEYTSSRFYPYRLDENERVQRSDVPMGYAFDLNSMEHYKSISFPNVTTVIFDEFLSRQGYLPNEYDLFVNALSTIIRDRDNVRIIMLGNTLNKYCPYFEKMGLSHVKEQEQGTIDEYTYGNRDLKVVVEYCKSSKDEGGKPSDAYFAFDNPSLKMITTGAWEIAEYPHLKRHYKTNDIAFVCFVEFDKQLLQMEIISTTNEYYMFVHEKTGGIKDEDNDIVYNASPSTKWNYRTGITNQRDELSRHILKLISENRVFYSTNEAGEILRNYIMWSSAYKAVKG